MRLVFATHNRGKVEELLALVKDEPGLSMAVATLADLGHLDEIEEDGATLADNALIKARAAHGMTGLFALADDSGLEVDALGGAPGVHSARYAGPPRSDERNLHKLLEALRDVPQDRRTARFRCVLCLVGPEVQVLRSGTCEGTLLAAPRGTGGFGYDPIFVPDASNFGDLPQDLRGLTLAELPLPAKNRLSHRGRAMAAMVPVLRMLARGGPVERA